MNILVVDDEELLQDVLGLLLRKEGFRPIFAKTGEEALLLYEREPVDLVLLDVMLPGMSGMDVLRQIRQRDPEQVVVVMTAYSSIEGAIGAMRDHRRRVHLQVPDGAGPGADEVLGIERALLHELERRDQFRLIFGQPAAPLVHERCQGGDDRTDELGIAQHPAVIGFDAPDRTQKVRINAIFLANRSQKCLVLLDRFPALADAPIGDALVDVLP